MEMWKETKLSEIAEKVDYGYTASACMDSVGPKFLRITDIVPYFVNYATVPYCVISDKHFRQYKVEKGDLLIARTGATTGYNYLFNADIDAVFASYLIRFRFDKTRVNPLFIKYMVKSSAYQGFINNNLGGAAQPGINAKILGRFNFKIPNLKIQDKIAAILSSYDDLIEKNNRKIAILQQMAEELYKEWFVRFRFPGYKTVRFYKGLPESWEYGTIKDLGSFVRGKNITADEMEEGDIPVISAGIEPSGFHNESNVQGISLTISSSGANAGFLRINYSDIWAADCSFLNDLENIFYMYELLNNMRPCIDNLQRGAAQPHVYPKDINKLKIVLPPIQLRTKFNEIAKQVHLAIATLQKQNKNLTQQRDLLLPRLMSGKLKVKA